MELFNYGSSLDLTCTLDGYGALSYYVHSEAPEKPRLRVLSTSMKGGGDSTFAAGNKCHPGKVGWKLSQIH